jgi:HAD superfamily hydrolase (TIGR01459 family)
LIFEHEPLRALIEQYDAFLIDQFGVLLDGSKAYPGATKTLALIAEYKKPVVILSNSGKRSQANCDRITAHGFERDHFITVITSGEIAYQSIAQAIGTSIDKDARVMVLARNGDPSPIADLGLTETTDPSQADLLLVVSRDLSTSREDYVAMMERFDKRNGRCICLNPDLNMLTPQGLAFSAGSIAKDLEARGGTVEWFGKPHLRIYKAALALIPDISSECILCIGDSIDHDIQGGYSAGLATALVRQGVHAHLSEAEISMACNTLNIMPDHVIKSFSLSS